MPWSSAQPRVLAERVYPVALAVADDAVFWAEPTEFQQTGGIYRVPLRGGTPARLSPLAADRLAADREAAYFTTTDKVMSVPVAGGPPRTLAMGSGRLDLALDGDTIYWSDGGRLAAMSRNGQPSARRLDTDGRTILALGAENGTVAWGVEGALFRAAPGGNSERIVTGAGASEPRAIAIRGGQIVWVNGTFEGEVWAFLGDGGGARKIGGGRQGVHASIALDEGDAFWITHTAAPTGTSPADLMWSAPVVGGPWRKVRPDPVEGTAVAFRQGVLYWIEGNFYKGTAGTKAGRVMGLDRR